jgi:hypothetical protein
MNDNILYALEAQTPALCKFLARHLLKGFDQLGTSLLEVIEHIHVAKQT